MRKQKIKCQICFEVSGLLFEKDGEVIIILDKKEVSAIKRRMANGMSLTKSDKDYALYT